MTIKEFILALMLVLPIMADEGWRKPVSATPEPSTIVLFGLGVTGMVGCGIYNRRKRK